MKRKPARGIPAAMVLAGGISRHGRHCYCRICVDNRKEREALAPDMSDVWTMGEWAARMAKVTS